MLHRVIDKETNVFIRDIDLQYDELLENEVAVLGPACIGEKRRWDFELKDWVL